MHKETWYDQEEDILDIQLFKGEYWKSLELQNGVVVDIAKNGKLMAVEIPGAKKIFGETKRAAFLAELGKLVANGALAEEDVLDLGEKINQRIAPRHGIRV